MLVLRRRAGESLLIGEEITIEVLEVNGCQVKLGIRAPRSVSVLRYEVAVTIRENTAAIAAVSEKALSGLAELLSELPSNTK